MSGPGFPDIFCNDKSRADTYRLDQSNVGATDENDGLVKARF